MMATRRKPKPPVRKRRKPKKRPAWMNQEPFPGQEGLLPPVGPPLDKMNDITNSTVVTVWEPTPFELEDFHSHASSDKIRARLGRELREGDLVSVDYADVHQERYEPGVRVGLIVKYREYPAGQFKVEYFSGDPPFAWLDYLGTGRCSIA